MAKSSKEKMADLRKKQAKAEKKNPALKANRLAKDAKRVGSPHREKLESKRKEESEARQREAAAKRQREGAKRMLVLQRLVSGNRRKLTRAPQK